MDSVFDSICRLYEDEADRQEGLLVLCHAQRRAVRAHDYEYVEAKAAEIQEAQAKIAQTELALTRLAEGVLERCGAVDQPATLASLACLTTEPFASRLMECDARIRAAQRELREIALESVASLQRTACSILECMESFRVCVQLVPESATITHAQSPQVAQTVSVE